MKDDMFEKYKRNEKPMDSVLKEEPEAKPEKPTPEYVKVGFDIRNGYYGTAEDEIRRTVADAGFDADNAYAAYKAILSGAVFE